MELSVIIVNYGTQEMTRQVIEAFLLKEPGLECEIILVDNKSREELDEQAFLDYPVKILKNRKNLGFAQAVNRGLRTSRGEYVLLLNSDAFVQAGSISAMLQYLSENPEIAALGPKMLFPDGSYQISAGFFPDFLGEVLRITGLYKLIPYSTFLGQNRQELKKDIIREVDWVSGGCMLVRRDVLARVGGFDRKFFLGVEDIDFCYQAKQAGYKIVYMPTVKVVHRHGASSGLNGTGSLVRQDFDRQGFYYFFQKHYRSRLAARWLLYHLAGLKIFYSKFRNKIKSRNNT